MSPQKGNCVIFYFRHKFSRSSYSLLSHFVFFKSRFSSLHLTHDSISRIDFIIMLNVNELLLSEDVIFQILLWLPVVSLLRFKSVCKAWCSLIQSPHFISQHKHKGTTDYNLFVMDFLPRFGILFSSDGCIGSGSEIINNNNKYQTCENLDLPEYFKNHSLDLTQMISCDGIICLVYELWDVFLWNPATKQFRILPKSHMALRLPHDYHFKFIGFGFDVKTNDYKVVTLYLIAKHHNPSPLNEIEVYSLNNNSWKSLDFDLPISFVTSDPKSPCQNGQFYCWMGWSSESESSSDQWKIPLILSFDFSNEVFGTIPLPNDHSFLHSKLAILRGKVATVNQVNFIPETRACHYQIWVMNEFGVRDSWTKLYTVGPFLFSQPIGFPKNEDLFLFIKDQRQLCLCDPVTQQINNLPFTSSKVQVAVYKESLLPVI